MKKLIFLLFLTTSTVTYSASPSPLALQMGTVNLSFEENGVPKTVSCNCICVGKEQVPRILYSSEQKKIIFSTSSDERHPISIQLFYKITVDWKNGILDRNRFEDPVLRELQELLLRIKITTEDITHYTSSTILATFFSTLKTHQHFSTQDFQTEWDRNFTNSGGKTIEPQK